MRGLCSLLFCFAFVAASCSRERHPADATPDVQVPAVAVASVAPVSAPVPAASSPAAVLAATVGTHWPAETRAAFAKKSAASTVAKEPYRGAIAFDADTGRVLLEDGADELALPASTLKLMLLLVLQEKLEAGELTLREMVPVSDRAYKTGGSQVWLDPKESFAVEDLLYALMIQSANDAAVALAEHAAGSCEAMVALMNRRARELGMVNTRFASVNGLPPEAGGDFDVTTPRDMAILCAELCGHPDIFAYTSATFRVFRPEAAVGKGRIDMRTHNPLLQAKTPGCDGLKTGWTRYAGFSIAATVRRGGRRVVIVLMGCPSKDVRDREISAWLERAFAAAIESEETT